MRSWKKLVLLALFLLALPYLVILLYAVEPIRPISTLMLRDLVLLKGYDRQWVEFDDIAPVLVQSVMMSEDGQFCSHRGVDWGEMKAVVQDALDGEATRGASTIPMQTAKNLFLWNSRSFVRKAMEMPLAIAADFVWSKRRLMEIYLNIAEWGPEGQFGVAAGANRAFGIKPQNLDWRTATLLVTALPNPMLRQPARPSAGMLRIAATIENRVRQYGDRAACVGEQARLSL